MTPDVDVLVAGGGPVGLAVAIEALGAGLSVVVVEPRTGPIDKACGEGLMPGAVTELARLGVHPAGREFTGITYVAGDRAVSHTFSGGPGLGVRRTALHGALTRRAADLGVEIRRAKIDTVTQDGATVTAAGVRAAWLMGCDGLHSTVRRAVGLERAERRGRERRFGLRRHFEAEPWSDRVEVHWSRHAEAYVTPVSANAVGIALLGPPRGDFETALEDFPALRARIGAARPIGPALGAGPMLQRTRARTAGRVRLVGDAAGYVDALTGEGIRVGLAQASAAISTLQPDVACSDAAYEDAWLAATRTYRRTTWTLLTLAQSPLRAALVPASATLPRVYGRVVDRLAA